MRAVLFAHILVAIVVLGPLFLAHVVVPALLRRGRDALPIARFFAGM